MVDLLPCPFCGGADIENSWDDYWSLMQRCVTCGAQGGVVEDNDPNCKTEVEKRAKAIELWNRRVPQSAHDDVKRWFDGIINQTS